MDLTNVETSTETSTGQIEPGRHILHWQEQDDKDSLLDTGSWVAERHYFMVGDSNLRINIAFTVQSENPKAVEIGAQSCLLMCKAMGIKNVPKDTSTACMGKSVSAELVKGRNGYLEIKDDYGKGWQPVDTNMASTPKPVEDDNIKAGPSDADLDAMGTTVASEDDAPF
tara:strand:- start:524 stop:1030 length:507 start_codon:yes stop_codon:yes gene_type:complete